jgi:dihydropteroate synthase
MSAWTTYDYQADGVRPCKVVAIEGIKTRIVLVHEGSTVSVMSHYVHETKEAAIADAKARRDKLALQNIAYWQRVLEREIGVAE